MIPRDRIDLGREDLGRAIGRLPRRIAYPLIFLFALVLWITIAIAAIKLIRFLAL